MKITIDRTQFEPVYTVDNRGFFELQGSDEHYIIFLRNSTICCDAANLTITILTPAATIELVYGNEVTRKRLYHPKSVLKNDHQLIRKRLLDIVD